MQILGIFAGTLYGWCTVGLVWPSLIGMIAVGSTEYCTVTDAFCTGFGNNIPVTIVVVYTLAAFMEESGLSAYLANWFISRKIGEGKPWVFTLLIFLAAYVLSALISLYATIIILWTIFYQICDRIEEEHGSKYTGIVIAGIVIICSITGMMFPFKPFAVIILGLAQKGTGMALDVNFVSWTVYNIIVSLVIMLGYMLICRFIVRPDMTKVKEAGEKFAYLRDEKMTQSQKVASAVLVCFILGLMIPSIVPKTVPGVAWLSNMGVIGMGVLCVTVLAIVKTKEDKSYVNIPQLISKGVNWELITLIAATMPICNALEAEECGVLSTVIAWMTQTFSGLGATAFLVIITVLFIVVIQVTHNLVLMMVFSSTDQDGADLWCKSTAGYHADLLCRFHCILHTGCIFQCSADFWQYRVDSFQAGLFPWLLYSGCCNYCVSRDWYSVGTDHAVRYRRYFYVLFGQR